MTSVALAAVVALAGCETDGLNSGRAMKSLSPELVAQLQQKNMPVESPLLVRLFKEESELEVWKQDASGRFDLLKTYPMCRWSGELGPKIKEGDRQAPEGFYTITPAQMNPNSQFYLSFNMGYPNAFDKAHGRTGAHLMVHGDCSSRGCYAMTDDQIGEIYALARESFFGGQRAFQVQAFPFRMTAANFARHRNNPNIPFWRMLKEGNDHFEVTRQEPAVEVCEKRYVFNPQAPQIATPVNGIKVGTPWGGFQSLQQQASLKFNSAGKCPAYEIPADVLAEVKAKQRQDDQQIASLSTRVSAAPIRTGRDGGMHPTFLAKLKPQEVREPDGTVRYLVDSNAAKQLGSYVNPPIETYPVEADAAGTAYASVPVPRAAPKAKSGASSSYVMAAADSRAAPPPRAPSESGGLFSSLFSSSNDSRQDGVLDRMKTSVGRLFGADDKPAVAARPAPKPAARPQAAAAPAAAPPPQPKPQPPAQAQEAAQPAQVAAPSATPARQSAASGASLMNGATPTVPAGNFDQRWAPIR